MTSERHLSMEHFAQVLGAGGPILQPIDGSPYIMLFTDPVRTEIGIRIAADSAVRAPVTGLEHLRSRVVSIAGERWIDLYVADRMLFTVAYPVLCSIADRIQLNAMGVRAAVSETAERLGRLLAHPDGISVQLELGLLGELMVLGGLVRTLGPVQALKSWRGPLREEHDFALSDIDVEVKTTSSERRAHWITSATQLNPTPGRALWLVSHQLTTAGAGGGRTLPEAVGRVRALIGDDLRSDFDALVAAAGWSEAYIPTCVTRWRRRDESSAFLVAEGFPRLTPPQLQTAGVPVSRMPELRYKIDLTGWQPNTPPDNLSTALADEEPTA
ncbi:PD-(D/E)XK motif protein [Catellatospora paridis]|uniref:PD-(D/E)XK motif protein n=1 Tax=Catellatospora paridis TaxID=1617086 RepID=UPI0012D46945|nr:PD-(D/E)XK motif protein [Catellatospora paridis]